MTFENHEKNQTPFSGRSQQEQLAAEIVQAKRSQEQENDRLGADIARLEARQNNHEEEREREAKSRKRGSTLLWVAMLLVTGALIGSAWYGFPLLQSHSSMLAKLPSFEESIDSVAKRVALNEEQIQSWASDRAAWTKRMANMEKRVTANLQLARQESQRMAADVSQRLQAEINQRMEPMLARLTQLESGQQAEQARLEQLREQLRNEVAGLRRETAQEMSTLRNDNSRGIADVNQQIAWTKRDLDDLGKWVAYNRVDFEASKNRTTELAPGVSLHITKTNVSKQTADGWVQLVPDGKTLWVHSQGILQPMVFFTQKDSRPEQFVITRVGKDNIVGYMRIPIPDGRDPATTTAASSESNSGVTYSASAAQ